ncbi:MULTISPECIES: hypothetical protein [Pseudomonas]|uniref:Uncharacterized protein n=1 Tax=Pseudomonas tritici TaxID=2745518 RepID=A0A8I0D0M8_9PSED|nr:MULTISPECIES: hypothetical protein [Pseudomonas]MBP2875113.1 hypothetical protein [Pseudomonas sp. SWRI144]MBW8129686.1 hypothetical protein [Pseudomonas sp. LAP_36]MBW8138639.1 hypothetical protein [Pseudomonas sp. PAMC 26818]QXH86341.1 hypothetical protein HU722_0012935 [Pseudomonas tritici]
MKIRITEILSTTDTLLVRFQSSIGSGAALWAGITPKIGDEHDVEFDLDEIFSWGRSITPSSDTTPQIIEIKGITQITAELTQVADEECAALQLGDSIVLVELDRPITQKSGYVDVRATRIVLYPTNI